MQLNFQQFSVPTGVSRKNRQTGDARESFADMIYLNVNGIKAHALAMKIYQSEGAIFRDGCLNSRTACGGGRCCSRSCCYGSGSSGSSGGTARRGGSGCSGRGQRLLRQRCGTGITAGVHTR